MANTLLTIAEENVSLLVTEEVLVLKVSDTGITIEQTVIDQTVDAVWGAITGNLGDQTDLRAEQTIQDDKINANTTSNLIKVKNTSDLGAPIAGVYTLDTDNLTYELSTILDLGTDRIIVTGVGVVMFGINPSKSGFTSATTGELITVSETFTLRGMSLNGNSTALCGVKASDAGTDGLTIINSSFSNFANCAVSVDNYLSCIVSTCAIINCQNGIMFSNLANNTLISTILFINTVDKCIDLNGSTTNAIDIETCTAILNTGAVFLNISPNSGNMSAEGFGTIRANKIDMSAGGSASVGYSPLDLKWEAIGNNGILDSDRLHPNGWGNYADTGSNFVVTSTDITSPDWLTNDANAIIDSHLPAVIREDPAKQLWDNSINRLVGITVGDVCNIRIQLLIASKSSNPSRIELVLDIGDGITNNLVYFDKDILTNRYPQTATFNFNYFTLSSFIANGGRIGLACDAGGVTITNRAMFITRLSSGAS